MGEGHVLLKSVCVFLLDGDRYPKLAKRKFLLIKIKLELKSITDKKYIFVTHIIRKHFFKGFIFSLFILGLKFKREFLTTRYNTWINN